MDTSIKVQNLKCGGCVTTITNKISEIRHISNININLDTSEVSFSHKNNEDIALVEKRLSKLGYPKNDEKNSIFSKASSMVSCATGKIN